MGLLPEGCRLLSGGAAPRAGGAWLGKGRAAAAAGKRLGPPAAAVLRRGPGQQPPVQQPLLQMQQAHARAAMEGEVLGGAAPGGAAPGGAAPGGAARARGPSADGAGPGSPARARGPSADGSGSAGGAPGSAARARGPDAPGSGTPGSAARARGPSADGSGAPGSAARARGASADGQSGQSGIPFKSAADAGSGERSNVPAVPGEVLALQNGGDGDDVSFDLFSTRRPKDFSAGLSSGLKNIGKGVVSGVAAAVTLPIMGAREGGLAGFGLGLGQGLVAAVVLPVSGAATGLYQIGRGVWNTPEAYLEARDNKEWDPKTREWFTYDLNEEAARVLSESEEDFLTNKKKAAAEAKAKEGGTGAGDAAGGDGKADKPQEASRPSRKVKDPSYYELLGVPTNATAGEIKRGYYVKARKLHPDKNPNDPQAQQRFQEVGAAYQVLSDEGLRERYDRGGKGGVEDVPVMDSSAFFTLIFGSEKFDFFVGELQLAMMMSKGMEAGAMEDEGALQSLFDDSPEMEYRQRKREVQCAVNLAKTLQEYLDEPKQSEHVQFRAKLEREAAELAANPVGATLLSVIGYVYIEQAENMLGFKHSVAAGLGLTDIKRRGHVLATKYRAAKSVYKTYKVAKKMEKKGQNKSEEAAKRLNAPAAAAAAAAAAGAGPAGAAAAPGAAGAGAATGAAAAAESGAAAQPDGGAASGSEAKPHSPAGKSAESKNKSAEERDVAGGDSDVDDATESVMGMVETAWNFSIIDIENTLRKVCRKLAKDASVSAEVRYERARGLELMGQIFQAKGVTSEEGLESLSKKMKESIEESKNMAKHKAAYEQHSQEAQEQRQKQAHAGGAGAQQAQSNSPPMPPSPDDGADHQGSTGSWHAYTRDELAAMKPSQLRAICSERGISAAGFAEKEDFIRAILART